MNGLVVNKQELGNIQSSFDYFMKFNIPKNAKILDVGCNYGSLIYNLCLNGYINVYGIDNNRESIKKGKLLYPDLKKRLFYYNGKRLPFESEKFDVVLMFDVIEHIPNVQDFLRKQVYRVLNLNGVLLFQTPNKPINICWCYISNRSFKVKWWKDHCSLQTYWSLKNILRKAGFTNVEVEKFNVDTAHNRNKIFKKMGILGLGVLNIMKFLPIYVYSNLWGIAIKKKSSIKIGIDARTLRIDGGGKTYAKNLLHNIKKRDNIILFGIDSFENYECIDEKSNQQNPLCRIYYENVTLPHLIKKEGVSIFHGLKGTTPKVSGVTSIVTVLDISNFYYPEFQEWVDSIYWGLIIPRKIKKADKIIAISSSTKNDLVKILNISSSKINVTNLAYDLDLHTFKNECVRDAKNFLKSKDININKKKIILNVNTLSPRKNIVGLIKAFNINAKEDSSLILIISGKDGWKTEEMYTEYHKSSFRNRIYFLGFTPERALIGLYNLATIFVYPSFYEGFGLPILDAQASGCPVITSNISSMPEVAGKGAILINPNNIIDIAKAMKKLIQNKGFRNELIKRGYKNMRNFSWTKCARETENIYEATI